MRIAIVVSRYNQQITEGLLTGALERLQELGMQQDNIAIARVPGAVEIPLIAQQFAQQKNYQAVICLGAIIRGETDHYDYVCQQVSYGCQKVALNYNIPIIFGVLTTHNLHQALERIGGLEGHKGREAADAALEMIALLKKEVYAE